MNTPKARSKRHQRSGDADTGALLCKGLVGRREARGKRVRRQGVAETLVPARKENVSYRKKHNGGFEGTATGRVPARPCLLTVCCLQLGLVLPYHMASAAHGWTCPLRIPV